jgi:hypothetical protein
VAMLIADRPPLPGDRDTPVDAGHLERLLGPNLSAKTRTAVGRAPADLGAALILGSPDFMRR